MGTKFTAIYNRFLNKITDDMYMELTPADTIRDLQRLLIENISGFEFPRVNLEDYTIDVKIIPEDEISEDDFIIGILWDDLEDGEGKVPMVMVENSFFTFELTAEEMNILALLMMKAWLQRQVTSIENTRMKYSGSNFWPFYLVINRINFGKSGNPEIGNPSGSFGLKAKTRAEHRRKN